MQGSHLVTRMYTTRALSFRGSVWSDNDAAPCRHPTFGFLSYGEQALTSRQRHRSPTKAGQLQGVKEEGKSNVLTYTKYRNQQKYTSIQKSVVGQYLSNSGGGCHGWGLASPTTCRRLIRKKDDLMVREPSRQISCSLVP